MAFRAPALIVAAVLASADAGGAASLLEGYALPQSVQQGDSVSICVSTDAATYNLEILRLGGDPVSMLVWQGLPGTIQAVPESAWAGCDWTPSLTIQVPPAWPSGVYAAQLTSPGLQEFAIFTVREDVPGSTARVLVQLAVNTWQAYEPWGGKALYDLISNGPRAHEVSFHRPYSNNHGLGLFPGWDDRFIAWMESEGFTAEYCTDPDVDADPALLTAYDLLLLVGHHEYWSKGIRDNVEAFLDGGGNVAIFGGNTCWWQVRYSPERDKVICYKVAAADPLTGTADSLVTVHWHDPLVGRPANEITGGSLLSGGYPAARGDYTVEDPSHWVLDGTGLAANDTFGGGLVIGYEVDGADFIRVNGIPVPTGTDGTPLNYRILATAPASNGYATLGLVRLINGSVFNGSSGGWPDALDVDPVTARITENVMVALCPNPFAGAATDVVLDDLSWSSSATGASVSLTFRNTSPTDPSRGIHGVLEGRSLGSFASSGAPLATFAVPSIPPGQSASVTVGLAVADLPPGALRIVPDDGGVPFPSCSADTTWAGGVAARWRVTGVADSVVDRRDVATMRVCPGAGFHLVQVGWDCADPGGTDWSLSVGPGWSAGLFADAGGLPGAPAADPLPPGLFTGWLGIAAESTMIAGATEVAILQLRCGGDSLGVELHATACACLDPTDIPGAPGGPEALRVVPEGNPATRGVVLRLEVPRAGEVGLTVHDVRGRRIRTLHAGRLPAGRHHLAWDGRDDRGAPVSAGVYFLRAASRDGFATAKVVVLD